MSKPVDVPSNYTWNDQYQVHIRKMDEQHKALFATAARLYRLLLGHEDLTQVDRIFSDLVRQTIVHFHAEEELMQTCDYPDYKDHKSLHDMLVQQLKDMQFSQQAMQSMHYVQPWIERMEVADYLSAWLGNHILYEDKKLGVFLLDAGMQ